MTFIIIISHDFPYFFNNFPDLINIVENSLSRSEDMKTFFVNIRAVVGSIGGGGGGGGGGWVNCGPPPPPPPPSKEKLKLPSQSPALLGLKHFNSLPERGCGYLQSILAQIWSNETIDKKTFSYKSEISGRN